MRGSTWKEKPHEQEGRGIFREYISRAKAEEMIQKIAADPRAGQMKSYIQHGRVTTYDHCISVARLSCAIAERCHMKVDLECLVRGAILHDYYLYDWHVHGDHLHGYHHPKIASRRAQEDFGLSREEMHIIESHMWPLTLFHAPVSREAMLVCLADKICSIRETGAQHLDSDAGNRYDGEVSSGHDGCPVGRNGNQLPRCGSSDKEEQTCSN